jgi:hypothetical protein
MHYPLQKHQPQLPSQNKSSTNTASTPARIPTLIPTPAPTLAPLPPTPAPALRTTPATTPTSTSSPPLAPTSTSPPHPSPTKWELACFRQSCRPSTVQAFGLALKLTLVWVSVVCKSLGVAHVFRVDTGLASLW